jgi:hypothetical protein
LLQDPPKKKKKLATVIISVIMIDILYRCNVTLNQDEEASKNILDPSIAGRGVSILIRVATNNDIICTQ